VEALSLQREGGRRHEQFQPPVNIDTQEWYGCGMEQTLTLACKPTHSWTDCQNQGNLKAFADACNYANQVVKPSVLNRRSIQSWFMTAWESSLGWVLTWQSELVPGLELTGRRPLLDKPVRSFKPTSADYDARIFALERIGQPEADWRNTLNLLGNYQTGKLKGRKPTSAQLCKHRDGLYAFSWRKRQSQSSLKSDWGWLWQKRYLTSKGDGMEGR